MHTPGPWHASESGLATNEGQIAVLANEDRIALVDLPEALNIKRSERWRAESPTRTASAHLIAAAPDMLDALKACLGVFDEARAKWPNSPVGSKTQAAMDAARAAISNAEGK